MKRLTRSILLVAFLLPAMMVVAPGFADHDSESDGCTTVTTGTNEDGVPNGLGENTGQEGNVVASCHFVTETAVIGYTAETPNEWEIVEVDADGNETRLVWSEGINQANSPIQAGEKQAHVGYTIVVRIFDGCADSGKTVCGWVGQVAAGDA